jgi:hypothetical protein
MGPRPALLAVLVFALLFACTGPAFSQITGAQLEATQISFGGMRSFNNPITVDRPEFVNVLTDVQRSTPPQESLQEFRSKRTPLPANPASIRRLCATEIILASTLKSDKLAKNLHSQAR